ncbi:ThiF family adenylyltransferase [Streptomyces sp. NBC_00237]|uniref:ThiF family adenylyltransferase n=1 Tax=Streptomyces sp. NBC_00237 TaxID=2975687 RepID=UPI002254F5C3|nr:ThiF family adenylyltransferase [Streptomyces sp. NBC_00237]MCX5204126.1 ThiF family adenylyltransferase [Streptomyces sp. NBC_00237]
MSSETGGTAVPDAGLDTAGLKTAGLDTARIDYLLGDAGLAPVKVVIVGLGSGGAVVLERLAMSGIGRWSLYDPDVLEPVNLVKHPGRRSDLGRLKTEIAREWLLDRNPAAHVDRVGGDVMSDGGFPEDVASADLVVCAVDTPSARSFVNKVCVEQQTMCVFGSVFRTGLGGEVYAYLPGESGCHDCLHRHNFEQGNDIENFLELTDEETKRIYGLGESDFTASGLPADISVVASFHAHYVLSLLAGAGSAYLTVPSFNWLTLSLRRVDGLFGAMYQTWRALLRPREDCHLHCRGARP